MLLDDILTFMPSRHILGNKREWCFTCEFEGLVLKAKGGNSPLSPVRLLSQIENKSNLGHGRQEDAHEFLRCYCLFLVFYVVTIIKFV